MLDIHSRIATLKRPPLLARAARFGVDEYRREIHLPRLLKGGKLPRHGQAVMQLLDLEADLEQQRIAHTGSYSPARHVDVLIAILGEAQLMRATTPHAI
jgi:hypothetical protein